MIRHQFGQVEFASEHWFRLAATTLAWLTRSAGLATPAKPRDAHIRRIDLVAINERMASLILVLREGAIKQALVDARRATTPSTSRRSTRVAALPQRAPGRPDRAGAPRAASPCSHDDDRVERLARARRRADRPDPARVRRGGRSRRSSATACST